jgi:hypothetical protein
VVVGAGVLTALNGREKPPLQGQFNRGKQTGKDISVSWKEMRVSAGSGDSGKICHLEVNSRDMLGPAKVKCHVNVGDLVPLVLIPADVKSAWRRAGLLPRQLLLHIFSVSR